MGMLHIIPELCYTCLAGFLIKGMSGCKVEMFYLNTKLTQSSANTRCIEMGYQGLAEFKTLQQQKLANDLVYFYNKRDSANVWIGLTYNMSSGSWWWPSGEEWTNNPEVWGVDEPNDMAIEQCARLYYTFYNTPKVVWMNRECFFTFNALCQRTKDLSSNYMRLLHSDTAAPVGSTAFRVRSLMGCVTSCVLDCSCQAVHYSGDECRLLTYYLLDSITTQPADFMGDVYVKI